MGQQNTVVKEHYSESNT